VPDQHATAAQPSRGEQVLNSSRVLLRPTSTAIEITAMSGSGHEYLLTIPTTHSWFVQTAGGRRRRGEDRHGDTHPVARLLLIGRSCGHDPHQAVFAAKDTGRDGLVIVGCLPQALAR
jgi:hypothetical protein